jgi:hypothetical protein
MYATSLIGPSHSLMSGSDEIADKDYGKCDDYRSNDHPILSHRIARIRPAL